MRKILALSLMVFVLSGCQQAFIKTGRGGIWIDAPLSGAQVLPGTPITVVAYASMPGGVSQMTMFVGNTATTTLSLETVSADLFRGQGVWTPPSEGKYFINVQAVAAGGVSVSSDPVLLIVRENIVPISTTVVAEPLLELRADSTSLNAGECTFLHWKVRNLQPQSIDLNGKPVPVEGDEQVCPCFTTTYDLIVLAGDKYAQSLTIQVSGTCETPTTPPPPSPSIKFWADSTNIPAGSCTNLHWVVDNASEVWLEGQKVNVSGDYPICLCTARDYTLGVIGLDGSKIEQSLSIGVTGSCVTVTTPAPVIIIQPSRTPTPTSTPVTPQPPADKTPPPVPAPLEPGSTSPDNPPDFYCPLTLRWQPVSDPSGVVYSVVLEKETSSGNWSQVGSWDNLAEPQKDILGQFQCDIGWKYRWRVRAIDGAGNRSNWSSWLYYESPLT